MTHNLDLPKSFQCVDPKYHILSLASFCPFQLCSWSNHAIIENMDRIFHNVYLSLHGLFIHSRWARHTILDIEDSQDLSALAFLILGYPCASWGCLDLQGGHTLGLLAGMFPLWLPFGLGFRLLLRRTVLRHGFCALQIVHTCHSKYPGTEHKWDLLVCRGRRRLALVWRGVSALNVVLLITVEMVLRCLLLLWTPRTFVSNFGHLCCLFIGILVAG